MLLAPSGGKSICICHSFIVSFLQQLWLFLGICCCSVFFAHATVTKRCQDHSDYGSRRLCFSDRCCLTGCFHYFFILFIFVPPLCWNPPCEGLLQEVLLLLGERCNRRGSKEYRPRDLHHKIHIYLQEMVSQSYLKVRRLNNCIYCMFRAVKLHIHYFRLGFIQD